MFKPLVIGSRMELVPKKSLRNNEVKNSICKPDIRF